MEAFDIFMVLAVTLGASWCSGINLYATISVLGLMHRFSDGFALPGSLDILAHNLVLWPAIAMYVIEFVADKVPAIDSAWDTAHTFLRIPAGAAMAAMALGDVPLEIQVLATMVGGGLALGAHATKATTRLAAHATGASAVVSPTVSLVEDAMVITTIGFIATNPILSLFLLVVMMVCAFFIMRMFWRLTKLAFRAIFRRGKQVSEPPSFEPLSA